jgi:hypothetical protein
MPIACKNFLTQGIVFSLSTAQFYNFHIKDVNCFDKYRGYLLNIYVFKEFQREISPPQICPLGKFLACRGL